jgi:hypothetical protein
MNRYLLIALLALTVAFAGCNLSDSAPPITGNNGDQDTGVDGASDTAASDATLDTANSSDASDAQPDVQDDVDDDASECGSNETLCGLSCINTSTNPDHCGDCNQRCRPPANAVVQDCQAGDCIYECDEGYFDLNDNIGDPNADGCEADCKPSNNGVEACDQIDNNCDGTVDEGCNCNPGDTRDCGQSEGACETGTQECTANGTWGSCEGQTGPAGETCDNIDNDCDGTIDENLQRACGTNEGACAEGTQTCSAGNWGSCDGGVSATAETCDGRDNDCDGGIDEDFPDKGTQCSEGVGACERDGAFVCNSAGNGLVCDATPANPGSETCDGVDNDCDGSTDEDLNRTCGTDEGVCSTGTETCSGGSWGSCVGATGASSEICDGLDNNSDGRVDEGFPNKGRSCTVGTGECERTGTYVCNGSGSGTTCDASPAPPKPEICDGLDNDCDGFFDEGAETTYYEDADGDGYGTSSSISACSPSGDFTATSAGDCNDSASNIYPGANEFCSSSTDYDCDGVSGCSDNDCNDGDPCSTSSALGTCSGSICSTRPPCQVLCGPSEECICGGTQCCPIGQNCLCR